jgi:hypothetical protein
MGRWLKTNRGITVLLTVLITLIAITLAVGGYALHEALKAVSGIQASRRELCVQQNRRHDATIAQLDRGIARLPAHQRRRANANKAFTVDLINALSPVRDCRALSDH